MFHLQPYTYITTKKVSKSGVIFRLPRVCGTRNSSVQFPVFSLKLLQDRGPGLTRYVASWHVSHCFSISVAEALNFMSAFVFFVRTLLSQGLRVQIVICCNDGYILCSSSDSRRPAMRGRCARHCTLPEEEADLHAMESGVPHAHAFCNADAKPRGESSPPASVRWS